MKTTIQYLISGARYAAPLRAILIVIFFILSATRTIWAQEQVVTGSLDETQSSASHQFDFQAGDTVLIIARATSGDLDTVLTLQAVDGEALAENDDYNPDTLDSALAYSITETGVYTIMVESYEGASYGDYTLTITTGDDTLFTILEAMRRIQLSGAILIRETPHFRIHYTLEGADDTTERYVDALAEAAEEVWTLQIEQMGWPAPPPDGEQGGDDRYDIYIASLKKSDGYTMGYTQPGDTVGDNPNTRTREIYASESYIVIENDFSEERDTDLDPISLMRATLTHEFSHAIQFGYDYADAHSWYYEATATWIETITMPNDQDATGYVSLNYDYPELCFGTTAAPDDGQLSYGDWLFIQSLVDVHGDGVVQDLWDAIATYEGFEALEETLADYGETIQQALVRYRVQNLARDYALAPEFGATVWLENVIRNTGSWTFTGKGVQEFGANYFYLKRPPGLYDIQLTGDGRTLNLWVIGVRSDVAEAFDLRRGGTIDTHGYDYVYLMVFNPIYDDNLDDCVYRGYNIDVQMGSETPQPPVTLTFDATNFEPLVMRE
jgi:hypothetical protein